jgi:hypothetical protein
MPTVSVDGKATVGVGHGDCIGESAGVEERGMSGEGVVMELGRPQVVSGMSTEGKAGCRAEGKLRGESDRPVVARKRGNARGAKGPSR